MLLNALQQLLWQRYLAWRARPCRLARFLGEKACQSAARPQGARGKNKHLRVAAAQVQVELFSDPLHYAAKIHDFVSKAASKGSDLLVFPENNGLSLLGLIPGMQEAAAKPLEDLMGQNKKNTMLDIFRFLSPVTKKVITGIFPLLAARYRLYIMAGSFLLVEKGAVVNRAFLFNPEGRLLGTQDKVHLLPLEKDWGIKENKGFCLFNTPLARLAVPICMDATYFETFRILERLGAEVVLLPIADPQPFNHWLALRGIWPRVQESILYGVKSSLVGNFFGYTFSGRSGIFAPLELTPCRDGILAESAYYDREDLVVADLDLKELHRLKKDHPVLGDCNNALYQKYFPSFYGRD